MSSQEEHSNHNAKYVFRGKVESMVGRLGTLADFPSDWISVIELAENGFYYTGITDRVKCYSCGKEVEGWLTGEDPCDPGWHHCNCEILEKLEDQNIGYQCGPNKKKIWSAKAKRRMDPSMLKLFQCQTTQKPFYIPPEASDSPKFQDCAMFESQPEMLFRSHRRKLNEADLDCEDARRRTFTSCKNFPGSLADSLSKDGFFYLGNLDRTQCYYCGVVLRNWAPGDNVLAIHQACSPLCKFSSQREVTVASTDDETPDVTSGNVDFSMVERSQDKSLAEFFPFRRQYHCNAAEKSGISCDSEYGCRKKLSVTNVDVKCIQSSIFPPDKIRCWVCSGGWKNWIPYDGPWMENQFICFGCTVKTRDNWIGYVREITNRFPTVSIRSLETYDIYSMILAMKIGLDNIRIINGKQSISSIFHDEFTRIPPKAQEPERRTEENRRGQKRKSIQNSGAIPKRKIQPQATIIFLNGRSDDLRDTVPPMLRQIPRSALNPLFPHLSERNRRLQTYDGSRLPPQLCERLANAGFFHTGQCVKCWHCGAELYHPFENDDQWEEHANCSPRCLYLQKEIGRNVV